MLTFGFWMIAGLAAVVILVALLRVLLSIPTRFNPFLERRFPNLTATIVALKWKAIEVALLAAVAAGGLVAFLTYKENNGNAMLIALQERDRQLRTHYMGINSPGKSLMFIFADKPTELTDPDYAACEWQTRNTIKRWAKDYMEVVDVKEPWDSIDQLYAVLWSTDAIRNPAYDRALAMMMHAIDYLFIVHDAFHANDKGYFSEEERNMWRAYIDDLGPSPFFLLALRDGQKYSYMMENIYDDIADYMGSKPITNCVLLSIYPAFFDRKAAANR